MLQPSSAPRPRRRGASTIAAVALALAAIGAPAARAEPLRVCADPNNMPFSDRKGEGFENKLATLVAGELGRDGVAYTWWAQRRGFLRNTLQAGLCDVVIGVPKLDAIATTRPYYRSTYVFVTRADRDIDISSMDDARLRDFRIGVHLIGDDGVNTPPVQALGAQGIVGNVKGYMIYGDYREGSPPSRLVEAVETGEVDIAAVWGPLAGYVAQQSPVPLRIAPIAHTERYLPNLFQYSIAMGVRREDGALRAELDRIVVDRAADIRSILVSYGVPLVEAQTAGASAPL